MIPGLGPNLVQIGDDLRQNFRFAALLENTTADRWFSAPRMERDTDEEHKDLDRMSVFPSVRGMNRPTADHLHP